MEKYGISTEVFSTYVSDFHGTSVALFEPKAPGQIPNKPVCVDCHGHHNIKSPDDPESTVMQENLLVTCQRCHPDATADFSSAWMGHYTPDQDTYPLMYYIDLFYKIFIPLILIPMAIYIVTDFSRKVINRRKESKHV
jgi:hypothetical protein